MPDDMNWRDIQTRTLLISVIGQELLIGDCEELMHRIFVVDDEPEIVEIMVEYFRGEEFEITGISDPSRAPESIASNQPEVVLLDIMMPEMDGYEVASRLKADARTAAIPIIFLTGKERQDDDLRFSQSAGDLYVHKPVPLPELKESVLFMINNITPMGSK